MVLKRWRPHHGLIEHSIYTTTKVKPGDDNSRMDQTIDLVGLSVV